MSGYRGGRKRYRDDYDAHDRRREIYETPEQKLRNAIFKLGEVDPAQELHRLAKQIQDQASGAGVPLISDAFRIGVTEQPYKIPYYAALLRILHEPNADGDSVPDEPSLGRLVLEDFWRGFQAFLDQLAWREIRSCIHFFAHLTMANVISVQSMISLLLSFTAVLDEFGVSHGRSKHAALCATEGLMIAGRALKKSSATSVMDIINPIHAAIEMMDDVKFLVQPLVRFHTTSDPIEHAVEILDCALTALKALNSSDFNDLSNSFPQPYADGPELIATPFDLPSVLVPPEVIELDGLAADSSEDAPVKKEEWPEYYISLFDNDVVPDPTTPPGYVVKSALLDIIDIFDVNRKECARILLEYAKWTPQGTFKAKQGAPPGAHIPEPVPGKDWQLESTVIECILGALFVLPESSQKAMYYIALITELCKLSPSTIGPAVGKSIRRMYNLLADGLDVEVAHKFADWFSVHMSNFNFQWVWKEWIPDLQLCSQHPKRVFMRKVVEYEIRLAYYDRIMRTLPEPFQAPQMRVIGDQAPSPDFDYDDSANVYHDAAQAVLNLLRGRSKPEDVMALLESLKNSLGETVEGDVNIDSVLRAIAIQSLLHIGSRSFSHFLNAVERYLPLLRNLAAGGISSGAGGSPSLEARMDILSASAAFWKRNRQMVGIVFDKLMQYQIVDPTDVVAWTFGSRLGNGRGPLKVDYAQWDLLRAAVDKANGRVMIARKRVITLRREEDDNRARANATDRADVTSADVVASMDVEAETKQDDTIESPALTTAVKAFSTLTSEQKSVLSRTLDGFATCLVPSSMEATRNPFTREVISEKAWHNRANWSEDEWNAWETWGWYRHFCAKYSPYLRTFSTTLGTVSLTRIEGSTDPSALLMKKIWNVATGQDG